MRPFKLFLFFVVLVALTGSARAQPCLQFSPPDSNSSCPEGCVYGAPSECCGCTGNLVASQCGQDVTNCEAGATDNPSHCSGGGAGGFLNCRDPIVSSAPEIEITQEADGEYTARLVMEVTAPWNYEAGDGDGEQDNPNGTLDVLWFSRAQVCDTSGQEATCFYHLSDTTRCYIQRTDLTCAGAPYDFGSYSLRAEVCGGPGPCGNPFPSPPAARWTDRNNLAFVVTRAMLQCEPPTEECEDCYACGAVGPGRAPVAGGPSRAGPLIGKTDLRYTARGAGAPNLPGAAEWLPTMGRHWSHTYAQRIILDPDENHVWLITGHATYREYGNLAAGVYETLRPSNDYRTLHRTGTGWELHDLDGTVLEFDGSGRWISTTDRNGNPTTGTYTGSDLTEVSLPDGRLEQFTYTGSRLASVTEVGVDATTRTWTLTWTGDDLTRLDRPDGTAWVMTYGDARFPGYLTLLELEGTDGTRRVETGWEYDADGNVITLWSGDTTPGGADAVDVWSLAFDDPAAPARTLVTDPLGRVTTYDHDEDPKSERARLTSVSGDCPSCGLAPNTTFAYADPANPMLPTRMTDGEGNTTTLTYDADGRTLTRTEAVGTAEERTTTWTYDATFPALVSSMSRSSVEAGQSRETIYTRDASGNVTAREIRGYEAGQPFDCSASGAPCYETAMTYNAAGQVETVDPPGHATGDVTSYTYDPARGELVADSRTDPLIGTTTYDHDGYHRRTSVTDVNGVVTETIYDDLDRVRFVIQRGPDGTVETDDLITEHEYNAFGDLLRTTLPEGNVIEYAYDAAGRLISIERKPDAATRAERTFFTLDAAGNRTREDLQRWDAGAGAWVTESTTSYLFSSRCHVDQVLHADGTVTEHDYDCNGNLTRTWDANHPRFPVDPPSPPPPPGDSDGALTFAASHVEAPPTATYTYDALDRLTAVTRPWAGQGGGVSTTGYLYDVQDHLVAVTDAEGSTTTYGYSDRDLLTAEDSPVSGLTTHTYNPHGELVETTDARGVTVQRTLDALDRVTEVSYPDPAFDVTYVYDDPAVDFSLGRLTAIQRHGESVGHAYDRFGRQTRDGALTYGYDKNGNRTRIGYPGGVSATYTHDHADRESTLTLVHGATAEALVTAAGYLPSGPLASLALGNGLGESRTFTPRYFPATISVPGVTALTYTTDAVGNPTAVERTVGASTFVAAYDYQDVDYFLTEAGGPWGRLAWTYDRIGNRLSETEGGTDSDGEATSLYHYTVNSVGGHTARLDLVQLADGGSYQIGYDAAGHQDELVWLRAEGGSQLHSLDYDPARRLAAVDTGGASTGFRYDGRGMLAEATAPGGTSRTTATYSSDGWLMHRFHEAPGLLPPSDSDGSPPPGTNPPSETAWVVYFAGRPLALYFEDETGATRLLYVTTDHLGAPLVATDAAGTAVWQGGIAPFGETYTYKPETAPPGEPEEPDLDDPDAPVEPPPEPPPSDLSPDDGRDGRDDPPPGGSPCEGGDCDDGRDGPTPPPGGGDPCIPPACDDGRLSAVFALLITDPVTQPEGVFLRYPGQWTDPVFEQVGLPVGLFYNGYRWYESSIGRYSKPDPLGLMGGGPDVYSYAASQPTRLLDPLGLAPWTCTGVGIQVAFLVGASWQSGTCRSDCSGGYRWVVGYSWRRFGFGASAKFSLPGGASLFTIDDGFPSARPDNFQYLPELCSTGGSAAVLVGPSVSATQFGQPGGEVGLGAEAGLGLGVFTGCGDFKIERPRRECCEREFPLSIGPPTYSGPPTIGPSR